MGARGGSAVLVPLVDAADGPSLLYEIRSATVRQPNEVCFPGGKTESGETAVQCALRETWEELSIPPEAVEIIGEMDFLHIRSNCLLRPVLGRVDGAALADIRPCAAEVAETFLVPLAWLRDHPPAVYIHRQPVSISDFPYEDAGISADYLWRPAVGSDRPHHHGCRGPSVNAALPPRYCAKSPYSRWNTDFFHLFRLTPSPARAGRIFPRRR